MNIAIIGHGRMGKEIDRLATERGLGVVLRLRSTTPLTDQDILRADVGIHFAKPDSVVSHVQRWASLKRNMVIGTTGWQKDFMKVKAAVGENKIGIVYASNFSIGVHIFFRLIRETARLINHFAEYDVFVHEAHHKDKLDSPSGTALSAAKILLENIQRKKTLLTEPPQGSIKPDQLQITSTRAGSIVGTHTVTFDSLADSIELKHTAKNRTGFVLGALLAAEWIHGKQGLFTMEEVLSDVLH
jgi:4-hydroxy-tetrahydrodipicolinate reductase